MPTQSGIFHDNYADDMQVRPTTMQRLRLALVIAVVVGLPILLYINDAEPAMRIINRVMLAAIGAIGLNLLTGFTGQISLGQGAFLAVGAFTAGLLMTPIEGFDTLIPIMQEQGAAWLIEPLTFLANLEIAWLPAVLIAAFVTALVGMFFGLPSLRLKGLYLAVATLAAQEIIIWVARTWDPSDGVINGSATGSLSIPNNLLVPGQEASRLNANEYSFYIVVAIALILVVIATTNLMRTHIGRAFIAIRDQDIAAEVMGVNIFRYKLMAFAVSSFIVGLAGALIALHSTAVQYESFQLETSIEYLAMIIIGGLGSISGSIYGAIFVVILPEILRSLGTTLVDTGIVSSDQYITLLPFVQQGAFGAAIVLTLVIEPEGIRKLWADIKDYFRLWPFSY